MLTIKTKEKYYYSALFKPLVKGMTLKYYSEFNMENDFNKLSSPQVPPLNGQLNSMTFP